MNRRPRPASPRGRAKPAVRRQILPTTSSRARRASHALSAVAQLCRRQPRRLRRDAWASRHAGEPGRWWRALRLHLRCQPAHFHAGPLDARPSHGRRFTLPEIVKALSRDNALAVGLGDRGVIAPGTRPISTDRLRPATACMRQRSSTICQAGRAAHSGANGYRATIVSGTVTQRDDMPTGALPGRLVRGAAN